MRIAIFILLLAFLAFARPPREHRGLYFNSSIGLTYMDFNVTQSDSWGTDKKNEEKGSFEGWSIPSFEFKFGRSFGNLFAIYNVWDLAFFKGEGRYYDVDLEYAYGDWYLEQINEDIRDKDAWGLNISTGVGFTFYPFRNPNSIMNGSFIGVAVGPMASIAFVHENDDNNDFDLIGIGTQFELGKDWWISDTWSLGIGIGYTIVAPIETDYDNSDGNIFRIMLRLTRG